MEFKKILGLCLKVFCLIIIYRAILEVVLMVTDTNKCVDILPHVAPPPSQEVPGKRPASLDSLTKEELQARCRSLLQLAQKAKSSKDGQSGFMSFLMMMVVDCLVFTSFSVSSSVRAVMLLTVVYLAFNCEYLPDLL